jgi:hypothetical protein
MPQITDIAANSNHPRFDILLLKIPDDGIAGVRPLKSFSRRRLFRLADFGCDVREMSQR